MIVQSCLGSFRLLLTCFVIVVVFGGAVVLSLEDWSVNGNPQLNSIPQGLWWGVQTLTTVGESFECLIGNKEVGQK